MYNQSIGEQKKAFEIHRKHFRTLLTRFVIFVCLSMMNWLWYKHTMFEFKRQVDGRWSLSMFKASHSAMATCTLILKFVQSYCFFYNNDKKLNNEDTCCWWCWSWRWKSRPSKRRNTNLIKPTNNKLKTYFLKGWYRCVSCDASMQRDLHLSRSATCHADCHQLVVVTWQRTRVAFGVAVLAATAVIVSGGVTDWRRSWRREWHTTETGASALNERTTIF